MQSPDLSEKDREFGRLVSLDEELEHGLAGENFDERDREIVGL